MGAQDNEWNALHVACLNGSSNCVPVLLKAGCDKHAKNDDGESALDVAKRGAEPKVLQLLQS